MPGIRKTKINYFRCPLWYNPNRIFSIYSSQNEHAQIKGTRVKGPPEKYDGYFAGLENLKEQNFSLKTGITYLGKIVQLPEKEKKSSARNKNFPPSRVFPL
jgi:hypothetical protein